jgi:Protein of unknown function (DUF2568)
LRGLNLALRFGLELAALGIAAWWGATAGSGIWAWGLAIAAPLAVIVVWGAFIAPKRRIDLPHPARLAIELTVWVAAAAMLADTSHATLGITFLAIAVASGALNAIWS